MVLGHDASEVVRARGSQSLRADPGVVGVDRVAAREGRAGPQDSRQGRRPGGPQRDRQTAFHDGEVCPAFPDVVEQGRLLQQPAGLPFEAHHRLEHVEPVALIVDR